MSREKVTIGYARVSTDKQDLGLAVQLDALRFRDRVFVERESGAYQERPELAKALDLAHQLAEEGKQVRLTIYKLDRLTRSMYQLLSIIEEFNQAQIQLVSLHENLETDSLIGRLLCVILGFVAENELENLRFRTREGLRKARERGVRLGARPIPKTKEDRIIHAYLHREMSLRQLAKAENISTSTIYKVLERNKIPKNRTKLP